VTKREALEVLSDRYLTRAREAEEQGDLREALRWINRSIYAAQEALR